MTLPEKLPPMRSFTARLSPVLQALRPVGRVASIAEMTAEIEALPSGTSRMALQEALPAGAARNAVDCALWDLAGRSLNQPVYKLIGSYRDKVLAYGSIMCGDELDGGLATPED